MRTIEYRTVNKSDWPRGEWDDEPDKMQWPDEATGLPCLIVRSGIGAWCGYVGISEGHPLYGKDCNDDDDYLQLLVHGGVTFSARCQPQDDNSHGVCHVPDPGEPDHVWWIGFDCAHAYDLSPGNHRFPHLRLREEEYRNVAFARAQCAELARQLAGYWVK